MPETLAQQTDIRFPRVLADHLLADASKAREKLGWQQKVEFPELVRLMVQAELAALDQSIEDRNGQDIREDW